MRHCLSTLRRMSTITRLPLSFLSFPWCSVLGNEASAFIPCALATAFWGWCLPNGPLGDGNPSSMCVTGCAAELRRACAPQGLLRRQGTRAGGHPHSRIFPRPKAQGHCTCCTQCHGAFSWIKRKWNIFTMVSRLSSNHSNLGFPQVWLTTYSDQTSKSFSFCYSVVSLKVERTNCPRGKTNQSAKQTVSVDLLHYSGASVLSVVGTEYTEHMYRQTEELNVLVPELKVFVC